MDFLVTIVDRSLGEDMISFYKDVKVPVTLATLGKGTASNDILTLLGFGQPEKEVFFSVVAARRTKKIMHGLVHRMRLDLPGYGIAFTVPVSSIGGSLTMKYFLGDDEASHNEGGEILDKKDFEVIIVILNRGYTDLVMDAARTAGARGGTVLQAKGVLGEHASRFFGVSLASEKEMVFIVVSSTAKADILKAIMAGSGMHTKAKAIAFTLPVNDLVGLRSLEEKADPEEEDKDTD